MIVIKYKGGLGNQMFQYAFHQAMKEAYPEETIKADLSHYILQNEHNGFELISVFGFQEDVATKGEVTSIVNIYFPGRLFKHLPRKIKEKIANNLQYMYRNLKNAFIPKKSEQYYKQIYHNTLEKEVFMLDLSRDWYLDGLWQNLQYWSRGNKSDSNYIKKIQNLFSFDDEKYASDICLKETKEELEKENSVGIHVRRGDFVDSKFDICPMSYYMQAIRIIRDLIPDSVFYFFTDDVEYVKNNFPQVISDEKDSGLVEIVAISHGAKRSDIDMWLMSKCHNLIISNSTFSFWGAILGDQERRKIIAPRYSIISKNGKFELSAPENWLLIDND